MDFAYSRAILILSPSSYSRQGGFRLAKGAGDVSRSGIGGSVVAEGSCKGAVASRIDQGKENARDRALMARTASGDRDALEQLFTHYNKRIYRSCLHTCRNADDAMEATQEAFLTVFKRLRDYHLSISSFRDYLFMASRNASLKIISKRRQAISVVEIPEVEQYGSIDATEDPERSLLIADQQQLVRRASASLRTRQLDALKMYELDGMDYSEIGSKLGIEANAVSQLISRARKKLRTEVRNKGAAQRSSTKICARALMLMPKKVDSVLSSRESAWLDQHIDSCETCKTNLNMIEEIGTSYRSLLPPSELLFERIFSDEALTKVYPSLSGAGSTVATRIVRRTGFLALGGKLAAATSTLVVLFSAGLVAVNGGGDNPRSDLTKQAAVSKASVSKSSVFKLVTEPKKASTESKANNNKGDVTGVGNGGQITLQPKMGDISNSSRSGETDAKKKPQSQIPGQTEADNQKDASSEGADDTAGAVEGGVTQPQGESFANEIPAEVVGVTEPSQTDQSSGAAEGYSGPPGGTDGRVWHTYSKSTEIPEGSGIRDQYQATGEQH